MKPKIGKTTEDEVMRYYELGPDKRYTFPCSYTARVGDKWVTYDRVIMYGESRYSIHTTSNMKEHRLTESITLRVFFVKQVAVGYELCHLKILPTGNEICGGLNENCPCDRKVLFASSIARGKEYERQRQHYVGNCPVEGDLMVTAPTFLELWRRRLGF